ncbi:hypothetical protein EUGRSUZ_G03252 [Eucalyptus grandis]|uniref:Uncharacterized protein n=2 Tax=Eucalyptus grandis TaxID=71139 RepID=A0ACC3KBI2_EUCGR|nr:hypothetical protein EUGRSUZ_G03252 [Eucalyptus grandis]
MPYSTLILLKMIGGKNVHGKSIAHMHYGTNKIINMVKYQVHHFSWNHTRGCRSTLYHLFPDDDKLRNINSNNF